MPRKSSRPSTVLVADDSDDAREMYAEYLRFVGFKVETAVDGRDALLKTIKQRPDALVVDLMMPGLTGWEVAAGVRANARTKRMRIIAVTGHPAPEVEEVTRRAGVDAYFVKPCLPQELAEEIGLQLQKRRRDLGSS